MDKPYTKIQTGNITVPLKVTKGHYATNHSHTNYYLDLTTIKCRASEAHSIAEALVQQYLFGTIIDTIICSEGTEVIGAFLADELTKEGFLNTNAHKTIYVITPEFNSNSQIIFRDNIRPMIEGKNVLILFGTVSTGKSANRVMEAVNYYGGRLSVVSAVFSAMDSVNGIPVLSVFGKKDLPDYQCSDYHDCPLCRAGQPIDGLVNAFGISIL
jgi:orotate phosphoribosyltransferase